MDIVTNMRTSNIKRADIAQNGAKCKGCYKKKTDKNIKWKEQDRVEGLFTCLCM
jgi:hypothetical protein